ncbi:DUF1697 domain-containing protein [Devosia sp. 1566]|uniref:DUF1697 domain-containing protein n=1 Tax=Devosia sp. 1566 TaxID=2499144 RepID=UPI000FDC07B8|nr:DUF1697 domain-containing protein [Devosia sp. 1566]
MGVYVILLRAIGPVTHKIMSMAAWRDAVAAAGFTAPQTYIATGNMIVHSDDTPAAVERRMNEIVRGLGLGPGNVAVVRTSAQVRQLVDSNPFPEAAAQRGGQMGVYFFVDPSPDFGWVARYNGPEQLHVEANHLIVDYTRQISASPKLPGMIEKRSGTATARNWNTLKGLAERASAREQKDH